MSGYLNKCPSCGSTNVRVSRKTGCFWIAFVFVSMGLAILTYPLLPKEGVCRDCGLKWKP